MAEAPSPYPVLVGRLARLGTTKDTANVLNPAVKDTAQVTPTERLRNARTAINGFVVRSWATPNRTSSGIASAASSRNGPEN